MSHLARPCRYKTTNVQYEQEHFILECYEYCWRLELFFYVFKGWTSNRNIASQTSSSKSLSCADNTEFLDSLSLTIHPYNPSLQTTSSIHIELMEVFPGRPTLAHPSVAENVGYDFVLAFTACLGWFVRWEVSGRNLKLYNCGQVNDYG